MASKDAAAGDERLTQINEELSGILEAKIEFLARTLSDTQRLTQKIANTELEIQRNASQHARLGDECATLDRDLAALGEKVKASAAERDARQADKYAREKEMQRVEWEIADRRKGNDETDGRIKDLERELEGLDRENKKLQNRIVVLEEGVTRMKKVREEYLNKIAGLDMEMKNLAGDQE
jgi:chromosome segregation ATPase